MSVSHAKIGQGFVFVRQQTFTKTQNKCSRLSSFKSTGSGASLRAATSIGSDELMRKFDEKY